MCIRDRDVLVGYVSRAPRAGADADSVLSAVGVALMAWRRAPAVVAKRAAGRGAPLVARARQASRCNEVAWYLGHSTQVLLTSYSHVLRGRQEHVASTMSALLNPRPSSEARSERSHRGDKLRDSLGDQPGLNR